MITDIDAERCSSPFGFLIAPPRTFVGRAVGQELSGLLLTLVPTGRRCRYPIPANGARHGTVDAVPAVALLLRQSLASTATAAQ